MSTRTLVYKGSFVTKGAFYVLHTTTICRARYHYTANENRCRKRGVQVLVEGPGHVPLNQIQANMEVQ